MEKKKHQQLFYTSLPNLRSPHGQKHKLWKGGNRRFCKIHCRHPAAIWEQLYPKPLVRAVTKYRALLGETASGGGTDPWDWGENDISLCLQPVLPGMLRRSKLNSCTRASLICLQRFWMWTLVSKGLLSHINAIIGFAELNNINMGRVFVGIKLVAECLYHIRI